MAKSRVLAARRTCFKPHNEPVTFAYCNSSASCDRLRKCGVVDCRARQGTDPSGTQPLSVSACTDAQKVPAQPLSGSGALLHRHDAFHGSMPKYMNFIRYDKAVANGRMLILYLRTQIRVAKKTPLRVEPLAGILPAVRGIPAPPQHHSFTVRQTDIAPYTTVSGPLHGCKAIT